MRDRCFLFDIDGTLIGSPRGVGRRAFERACLEAAGLVEALAEVNLAGNTDRVILDEAFQSRASRPPTDEEAERVLAAYLQHLAVEVAAPDALYVLPAVEETLAHLIERGAIVGLATGNLEAGARLKLERAGLWSHFPFGGFGSDARDRGELVRVAVRRAEGRAGRALVMSDVWVVGDTPRDVAAAHAAGVRCAGIATGRYDGHALRAAGADEVYDTLAPFLARWAD